MLASVIEAVIGACYLHAGYERTADAVVEAFTPEIEDALSNPVDFKSALQELLARRGAEVAYEVVGEDGPPHDRATRSSPASTDASAAAAVAARSTPSRRRRARRRAAVGGLRRRMRLKSLTLDGFKSFPDRTRLDFGPGVSVVVGPNGSGKSNVTDAVLWAMGEQSPLAVRGQSMQDVIFGGGRGVNARSAAEVEIVLDNADGEVDLPLSEISIARRLDRNGEGSYRLNGARCRLTDVIEVLSDTGLGKETHSVISQGRVEAIVTSKPRERRLLIEEAAGLGKHRKRRRRAQLKLERTQENLDRALDIEREARSGCARSSARPKQRSCTSASSASCSKRAGSCCATRCARGARSWARLRSGPRRRARARLRRGSLQAVIAERGEAERALSERADATTSCRPRSTVPAPPGSASGSAASRRRPPASASPRGASATPPSWRRWRARSRPDAGENAEPGRIGRSRRSLPRSRRARERELERELAGLEAGLERGAGSRRRARRAAPRGARGRRRARLAGAQRLAEAEREAERARREAARVGSELAAANQFLRSHPGAGGAGDSAPRC